MKTKSSKGKSPRKAFDDVLKKLDEEDMRRFISDYSKRQRDFINNFLSYFPHKIDMGMREKYEMIVESAFKDAEEKGSYGLLIDPDKAAKALKPVYAFLDTLQKSAIDAPYEAFVASTIVIEEFALLYEDFQEVGADEHSDNLIYQATEILQALSSSSQVPYEFKDEMFNYIVDEMSDDYLDMEGISLQLLEIAGTLCHEENNDKFLEAINTKIGRISDYRKDKFIKLKIDFYKKHSMLEKAQETIKMNIDEYPIRDIAIKEALEESDFILAVRLAKEGIDQYKNENLRGIVARYEDKLLEIYEKADDHKNAAALAEQLFKQEYKPRYYRTLKKYYDQALWEEKVEEIRGELMRQHGKHNYKQIYLDTLAFIYIEEKRLDDLYRLLELNPYLLVLNQYAFHVREKHSREVLEMYRPLLYDFARDNMGRKKYMELAGLLQTLSRDFIGGEEFIGEIVDRLIQMYVKRPAMIEELAGLKSAVMRQNSKNKVQKVKSQQTVFSFETDE